MSYSVHMELSERIPDYDDVAQAGCGVFKTVKLVYRS